MLDLDRSEMSNRLRVALFASHRVGKLVSSYFANLPDEVEVVALYLDGMDSALDKLILEDVPQETPVFAGRLDLTAPAHFEFFQNMDVDLLITVYWPWLVPSQVIEASRKSINFHPAMLPKNRGWYPHVFNIIEQSPAGVTLHALSERPDSGKIWAQCRVPSYLHDTAKSLYVRLEDEIFSLFVATWRQIADGTIAGWDQEESMASYNRKDSLEKFDELDLDEKVSVGELLAILRARSFGQRGFAYFMQNGKRHYLNLRVSATTHFEDTE